MSVRRVKRRKTLRTALYDVAHGCSGSPKMCEIALDCSSLFLLLGERWWYSVVSCLLI